MSTHKYLDETGLARVWSKIRSGLSLKANKSELSSVATSGTISSLDDITISSPSDGQVLKYDSNTEKWVNEDGSSSDIMVVTITATYDENLILSSDKTYAEIVTHLENGGIAICVTDADSTRYLSLNNYDEYHVVFSSMSCYTYSGGTVEADGLVFDISSENEIEVNDSAGMLAKFTSTTPLMDGSGSAGSSNYTARADHVHPTDTSRAAVSDVLTKTNTTSYTPSGNYNPATKKYVDDAVSGFSTSLSGLSDTTITSPSNEQMLVYNSTSSKWENATLALALSGNTIQLKQGNTVISSISLPVYNGGVSS